MTRYKLVRIVDGRYLSANTMEREPDGDSCLEYKVGEKTSVKDMGVACYKKKENALVPKHIKETQHYWNGGDPIALLKLKPIGRRVFTTCSYRKGMCYEGGINSRGVEVLEVLPI